MSMQISGPWVPPRSKTDGSPLHFDYSERAMVPDAQRLQIENARKHVLGLACEAVTKCVLPALGATDSKF